MTVHLVKTIKEILAFQKSDVLDCPGNNPDMNPTESLWNDMKDSGIYLYNNSGFN